MKRTTTTAASIIALAAVFAVPTAHAQTIEDLQAQIEALEAAVAELKATVAEKDASQDDDIIRLKNRTENLSRMGDADGVTSDGMRIGETVITLGGFVDVDVNVTDTSDGEIAGSSIARDFYIPSATPVGGTGEDTPDTDFTAEATRFFLTAANNAGPRTLAARVELDFLGSGQGNELVSNSYSPRLRQAFFTIDDKAGGKWLAGQSWSTFQNTSSIPESASFLALSDGMVFVRQAQVRYTKGPWQFAVENPNTREFFGGARDDGFLPDVVAKYTAKGDWGNVSLAALGRQLVDELVIGDASSEETAFGWGLSVAGDVDVTDDWGLKFSLTGGHGVGRYIGLAAVADARFDAQGELEAITSVGGLAALHGPIAPKTRLTVGYSGLFADSNAGENESVQSALAVLARDIAPRTTLAGEVLYGRRTVDLPASFDNEGDIFRFTLSTKYAF